MAKKVLIRGDRVRRLREAQKLTQGQLHIHSGVDQSLISRIERGIRPNVYVETLGALATGLKTTSDYLLGLTASPFPPDQSTVPSTEIEWMLLEKFRDLDEEHQRLVIAQLDLLLTHIPRSRPAERRIVGGEE